MPNPQQHRLSFWESDTLPSHCDVIIIGAGLVGIHAALQWRKLQPSATITILEKEAFGHGASSKNAGFVCFGTPGEILADMARLGESTTKDLIRRRYKGMESIRSGDHAQKLDLKWEGGFEIFSNSNEKQFHHCCENIHRLNDLVEEATGIKEQFHIILKPDETFKALSGMIGCQVEGALHPGRRMNLLINKCSDQDIQLLRSCPVQSVKKTNSGFEIITPIHAFYSDKVILATNGYEVPFLSQSNVCPTPNQVYLTTPIEIDLKGTYHSEEGYIYLRKVGDRILIGGGRNHRSNPPIQGFDRQIEDYLMNFLHKHMTIPEQLQIEQRWIGQLGVGPSKEPIIEEVQPGFWRAVRLGGMGVAIGAEVGAEVAQKCWNG